MGYISVATATSKGSVPFWLGNLCGGCHNPIIRACGIEGEAERSNAMNGYGNAGSVAESNKAAAGKKASADLKIALHKGLTEIQNGTLLEQNSYKDGVTYSLLGTTEYFGVSVYSYVKSKECPYCGHIDTWVVGSTEKDFKKICPVTERPQLTMSKETAMTWAKTKGIALKKLLEVQEMPAGDHQNRQNELRQEISGLKEELKLEQLNAQIKQKNSEYWDVKSKKISFFGFGEKKKQQQELQKLDEELQQLKTQQETERKRISLEIHQRECALEAICQQIRGYGKGAAEHNTHGNGANTTIVPDKRDDTPAVFCEI